MKFKKYFILIILLTFNISYNRECFKGTLDNLGFIHKKFYDETYFPINIDQYKLNIGEEYTFYIRFNIDPNITNLSNSIPVFIIWVHDGKEYQKLNSYSCIGSCIIL